MATAKKDLTDPSVQGHRDLSERVLLPVEAAQLLRISIHQLYHLTSQKKLPFTKIGGALRFDRVRLLEFIADGGNVADHRNVGARKAAPRGSKATGVHPGSAKPAVGRFTFNTPPRVQTAGEK